MLLLAYRQTDNYRQITVIVSTDIPTHLFIGVSVSVAVGACSLITTVH